jgi:hypothetical protein
MAAELHNRRIERARPWDLDGHKSTLNIIDLALAAGQHTTPAALRVSAVDDPTFCLLTVTSCCPPASLDARRFSDAIVRRLRCSGSQICGEEILLSPVCKVAEVMLLFACGILHGTKSSGTAAATKQQKCGVPS